MYIFDTKLFSTLQRGATDILHRAQMYAHRYVHYYYLNMNTANNLK